MKGVDTVKVLIVDDSSFMRKKIAQILDRGGHAVVGQASDGQSGFEAYRTLMPDVVIMDVTMQGMDGLSGMRLIRGFDPSARVIFTSMLTDPSVVAEAKALGAVDFIAKDSLDHLLPVLGVAMGKGEGHHE